MILPATKTTRHAEESARERARIQAYDQGYAQGRSYADAIMMSKGGASASPNSPPSPVSPESPASPVRNLALAIGQDRILLPPAVIISRTFSEEGGEPVEMATAITFDRLTFTIEEAVRLGVLTPDGRFDHTRASVLLHATPAPGSWVRPWQAGAMPAIRPRV
jgi:hypothetical protein